MAKLALWIDACLTVMKDNVGIIEECYRKNEMDLMIQQTKVFSQHIISFINFLEERRRADVTK